MINKMTNQNDQLTGTRRSEDWGLPCQFLKMEEMCPDFAKKCPNFRKACPVCVHIWVEFSFKIQFKRYWRKTPKFFPAESFFWLSYMKRLSKCPYSKKPPLPRKSPGCAPVSIYSLWFCLICLSLLTRF